MRNNFKKIFLGIVFSVAGFLCMDVTYSFAAPFTNGQCQMFAREGKKIEIFSLTQEEDYTTEAALMNANVFCVEVGSASTTVRWVDLRESSEELKKHPNWQFQNVVREEHEYEDLCEVEFNTTDWSTTQNYTQPANIIYTLVNTPMIDCDIGDDEPKRQRYRFNVRPDIGTELYLYYMRPATLAAEQLPNPITGCAAHNANATACNNDSACYHISAKGLCAAKADTGIACAEVPVNVCSANLALHCKIGPGNTCIDRVTQINTNEAVMQMISSTHGKPAGYVGPIPDCAFTGECRKIEDLIEAAVNIAEWLFSIIAGLAFVFFVYGGITMIASFGNSEKVMHGKKVLVAAVIGLVITFSAYMLVGFIVKAIGILPGYSLF